MKIFLILFFLLFSTFSSIEAQNKNIINILRCAPKHEVNTIDHLVKFIDTHTNNDYEKAIGAYYWVATHIKYDVKKYVKDKPSNSIPFDVFKKRKAVCIGYANLYQYLCRRLNLECQVIRGYSKGFGYKNSEPIMFADHGWNAVKIDSEWRLIDVTWASGTLKKNILGIKFTPHYTEDFFMVNPKNFIFKHLPESPMWQLLNYPISVRTYVAGDKKIKDYLNSFHDKQFIYNDTLSSFFFLDTLSQGIKYGEMSLEFNRYNTIPLAQGIFASIGTHIIKDSLFDNNGQGANIDSMIKENLRGIDLLKKSNSSRKAVKRLINYKTVDGYNILAGLYLIKSKKLEHSIDLDSIKEFNILINYTKPIIGSLEHSVFAANEGNNIKYQYMIERELCDKYNQIINLYKSILFDESNTDRKKKIENEIRYIGNSAKKYISKNRDYKRRIIDLTVNNF